MMPRLYACVLHACNCGLDRCKLQTPHHAHHCLGLFIGDASRLPFGVGPRRLCLTTSARGYRGSRLPLSSTSPPPKHGRSTRTNIQANPNPYDLILTSIHLTKHIPTHF
ncbi:hypothetical protein LY76DRAFT_407901 [Colletotrichum caudatum]|nr:hypothetical protein LY76DRAFT_407901 [Colletotrichum caudatum]